MRWRVRYEVTVRVSVVEEPRHRGSAGPSRRTARGTGPAGRPAARHLLRLHRWRADPRHRSGAGRG